MINQSTAHLANEFALKAKTDFKTALEWYIFLHGIAEIDSKSHTPKSSIIQMPVSQIKTMLKSTSGDFYRQIRKIMYRMAKSVCIFENDILIDGHSMPRILPIFSEANISKKENGKLMLRLEVNPKMNPVIKGLSKNFCSIKPPSKMISAHAINFLLYAKAERDRKRKRDGQTTIIQFKVEDLKNRLNIQGKYPRFYNFKKRVLDTIKAEINQTELIKIADIQYEKTGKRITSILFFIQDEITPKNNPNKNTAPTDHELESLTYAQIKAYRFLTEQYIYPGIALRKIIRQMPSSICEGYEDYFCQEVYKIVIEKSKVKDLKGRAAIMVDWFKKDIFKNDHFSRIIENVHSRKKKLCPEKRLNRTMAQRMTSSEFVAKFMEEKNIDKNISEEFQKEEFKNINSKVGTLVEKIRA